MYLPIEIITIITNYADIDDQFRLTFALKYNHLYRNISWPVLNIEKLLKERNQYMLIQISLRLAILNAYNAHR